MAGSLETELSATIIDAIALVAVVFGTAEAVVGIAVAPAVLPRPLNNHERRTALWLRYARWLVAALTFQLAADIIETSIAPSWDDVGRLAVVAADPNATQLLSGERCLDRDARESARMKHAPDNNSH